MPAVSIPSIGAGNRREGVAALKSSMLCYDIKWGKENRSQISHLSHSALHL